ncbi:MAG: TlpA disulfide reductase family protein [Bacteroidota bacterium]
MKLFSLLGTFLFVIQFSFAQVHITGKVKTSNEWIELWSFSEKKMGYVLEKKVKLKNDRLFSFKLSTKVPNMYQLRLEDESKIRLSTNSQSKIEVNIQEDEVSIKGSPESIKMISFSQEIEALQNHHFGSLKKQLDKAMAKNDQELAEQLMKKANAGIPNFVKDLRAAITSFGNTPAKYYAIQFSDFNKEQGFITEQLKTFEEHLPESPVTKALKIQLEQSSATAMGKTPPPFETKDVNGQSISLNQFKGKVVLIDFWASWCRACRVENPKFQALFQEYNSQQFEIISISSDETKAIWNKAVEKDGVKKWNHILDSEEKLFELYSISSLPQNVVLGKDGVIIGKNIDAKALKKLLEAHL